MASFWKWLKSLFSWGSEKTETPNEKILRIAMGEIGVKEKTGGENPRIIEYHAHTSGKFDEDEVPWCSSFISWVMDQCDLDSTNNALAISYASWGNKVESLAEALPGDIIVRSRSGGNHVHILTEKHDGGTTYKALGGNQSDAVNIGVYPVSGIKAIRRAVGEPTPKPGTVSGGKMVSLFPKQEWTDHALKLVKASRLSTVQVSDSWFKSTPENWVHLIAAMAKYESSFKPESTYKENFENDAGESVISTGLLQLSYESSRGYGFKGITTEQLKDPFKNIEVGVKILEKWAVQDGVVAGTGKSPYRGGSRYWSVLRASPGKLESVKATYKGIAK